MRVEAATRRGSTLVSHGKFLVEVFVVPVEFFPSLLGARNGPDRTRTAYVTPAAMLKKKKSVLFMVKKSPQKTRVLEDLFLVSVFFPFFFLRPSVKRSPALFTPLTQSQPREATCRSRSPSRLPQKRGTHNLRHPPNEDRNPQASRSKEKRQMTRRVCCRHRRRHRDCRLTIFQQSPVLLLAVGIHAPQGRLVDPRGRSSQRHQGYRQVRA